MSGQPSGTGARPVFDGDERTADREHPPGEAREGLPADASGRPLLISIEEAAQLLGLGRTGTYGLISAGRFQSVTLGRRRLVVRKDLENFVDRLVAEQMGGE